MTGMLVEKQEFAGVKTLGSGRTRCRAVRCGVHGVRFEDVLVDGLAVISLLHLSGCVFKHVTLTGNIGPLMTTPPNYSLAQHVKDRFTAGIVAYYAGID
jgi:hypothetical protein